MLGYLCDIQSTQRASEGMHVDRSRTADIALNRRASDRAGLTVIDMHGDLFLVDEAGSVSWFNPLLVDKHTKILFDAMHFSVTGGIFARRIVSPTGASVRTLLGRGKSWRKVVVDFAASHPSARSEVSAKVQNS